MNNQRAATLVQKGLQLHQQNDLNGAERIYKDVLNKLPQHVDALYLLGTLKAQQRHYEAAEKLLKAALATHPHHASACLSLGNIMLQQNKLQHARRYYQQSLAIDSRIAEAELGLGSTLAILGDYQAATIHLRRALNLQPNIPEAMLKLGRCLAKLGEFDAAIQQFQETLRRYPRFTEALGELGEALVATGRHEDAIDCYRHLIATNPTAFAAYNNLGNLYRSLARYDFAKECYLKAIELEPNLTQAYNNLGNIYKVEGLHNQAIDCYKHALALQPGFSQAHSNLLLCLNYVADYDRESLFSEHVKWASSHGPAEIAQYTHNNILQPDKKLRIGYVSPDLRNHAVARFFEPLISHHDPDVAEIFCYAELDNPDETTERLRSYAQGWCVTTRMSDTDLAAKIRADQIDILVDLAGHTANNRLPAFAYKPAPVQITYLGYPNTSGMTSMDYRITDTIADPEGTEHFYSERLIRLKHGMIRYQPRDDAPPVAALPAQRNGYITFGSLNNLVKMNPGVIDAWCSVLRAIPTARLLLFRDMLQGSIKLRYQDWFSEQGIAPDRIELRGGKLPASGHLSVYNEIDIVLDSFPWNGHVTNCEALWMGVPVISLTGRTHAGLLSASLLNQIGLPELLAETPDQFIAIAKELSLDTNRLSSLRQKLRDRLRNSPLCDGRSLAAELEEAYRDCWKVWCAQQQKD